MEFSKTGTSIEMELFVDDEKLGTLAVGRGSLTWFGNAWKHGLRSSKLNFSVYMEG